MTQRLENYLRMYRKKSGLSLDELGFLLGHRSGSTAGKHERFRRLPTVTTALAYEVVFRRSARELFAGIYDRVEHDTVRRALDLEKRLNERGRQCPANHAKQEYLRAIYLPVAERDDVDG